MVIRKTEEENKTTPYKKRKQQTNYSREKSLAETVWQQEFDETNLQPRFFNFITAVIGDEEKIKFFIRAVARYPETIQNKFKIKITLESVANIKVMEFIVDNFYKDTADNFSLLEKKSEIIDKQRVLKERTPLLLSYTYHTYRATIAKGFLLGLNYLGIFSNSHR